MAGGSSAPSALERAQPALRSALVLGLACGFAFLALEAWWQVERLLWRPYEVVRMLQEAGTIAIDFPGRFFPLVLLSVGVMLAAEYRPGTLRALSAVFWLALGAVGTGAFVLGTFDVATRWALAIVLGAGLACGLVLAVRVVAERGPAAGPSGRSRPLLPVVVGVVAGLLAARASIEPVTEWDAVIYHVSYARDWIAALPGLPHAAGPSVGAELSYNYPALFPSAGVAVAAPLHAGVAPVLRLISPLAAITLLALLRTVGPARALRGWAAPLFLLGSTFFVAYGEWPTSYLLLTLLVVIAALRLADDGRVSPSAGLCLGLVAETGLIGMVLAALVLLAFLGRAALGKARRRVGAATVLAAALLAAPVGAVVAASLRRTDGLLFPWVTWPGAAHFLPATYWRATEHEILANSYAQFDAATGDFGRALAGVARSGLLAPGGLVLTAALVAGSGVLSRRGRRELLIAAATLTAGLVLLVALELVWLRYFLVFSVAGALGLAVAAARACESTLGPWARVARAGVVVAACSSVLSGAAYAIAGPNDRTFTASTDYAQAKASAFETGRAASSTSVRRLAVFGDDSRAWDDIATLDTHGVEVGTFDIRNYYLPYVPRLQLDGLAGSTIRGSSAPAVARSLESRGIGAVLVPSWFWEPGPAHHPLVDRSPVTLWVGAAPLRAVRVYLPDEYASNPTVLYADGPAARRRIAALLPQPSFSLVGPLSSRRHVGRNGISFSGTVGGGLHWRVGAPVTEAGGPSLRLVSTDAHAGDVSVYEPRTPTLFEPARFLGCASQPRWARRNVVDVVFPGSPLGFAVLDIGGGRRQESFGGAGAVRNADVLVRSCGDPTTRRGGIFPTGNPFGRILARRSSAAPLALGFDYLDAGRTTVTFNVFDPDRERWHGDVASLERCGTGTWRRAEITVPRESASWIELAPVVPGKDLTVRNLRLLHGRARPAPACGGGR